MRLPIKDKYFQEIKNGKKRCEFRDAHLTLINIKTKETLRVDVEAVHLFPKNQLPKDLQESGMFKDQTIIAFDFKTLSNRNQSDIKKDND